MQNIRKASIINSKIMTLNGQSCTMYAFFNVLFTQKNKNYTDRLIDTFFFFLILLLLLNNCIERGKFSVIINGTINIDLQKGDSSTTKQVISKIFEKILKRR